MRSPTLNPPVACDFATLSEAVARIARDVAAAHASDVDANARFPAETLDALRDAHLLSALLPRAWGGAGLGLRELGQLVALLAEACASSAMVLAMHYNQVACLMRHGADQPVIRDFLQDLVRHQWLVASITSEVGTSGDTRSSICFVQRHDDRFTLEKNGTVGSYCAQADAILVTARNRVDSPSNDQVLVLLRKDQLTLKQTTTWNMLGMRGTCSPGFELRSASVSIEQIVKDPFATVAAVTMVPYSHILWAALWTGIAAGACAKAGEFIRLQARQTPGKVPPQATELASLGVRLQSMRQNWESAALDFDALADDGDGRRALESMRWSLRLNNLKIFNSEMAPQIVHGALQLVGMAGYANEGRFSMGRAYRDSLSAALMISNARLRAANASTLLMVKKV
jgi:acyl-CoA dehydrogenase